uniref:Uncharacterized protein n=1 Tax=Aegilops tauschii subsp. strangulata TaxID=200361 RepID=A0A453SQD7_AEGTS
MINRYGPWMDTNLAVPLDATRCKVVFDYFLNESLLVYILLISHIHFMFFSTYLCTVCMFSHLNNITWYLSFFIIYTARVAHYCDSSLIANMSTCLLHILCLFLACT